MKPQTKLINSDSTLSKPIYLITDGGPLRQSSRLVNAVFKALRGAEGNIGFVQLREQIAPFQASEEEIFSLAKELRALCDEYQASLIINRREDLVNLLEFDGLHIGFDPTLIYNCKQQFSSKTKLGVSVHSLVEAQVASSLGADYILLSPIFAPLSKPNSRQLLGLEVLKNTVKSVSCPVFALGGITAANAGACRSAGAAGIATISAILAHQDPGSAATQLSDAWNE